MGTNYYLYEQPACPTCGRGYEPLHIGKSSAGWCFSLHVIPEEGIHDLPDWQARWSKPGAEIKDGCNKTVTPDDMLKIISERRRWARPLDEEFLSANDAVHGPNNLARHRLGRHCIGYGAGTWDLIPGSFA